MFHIVLIWPENYMCVLEIFICSIYFAYDSKVGFPGGTSGKEHTCQCRRHKRCGFNSSIRKIPWRRAWKHTPVFLPGGFPWTEELGRLHRAARVENNWSYLAHMRARPLLQSKEKKHQWLFNPGNNGFICLNTWVKTEITWEYLEIAHQEY